MKKIAFYDTKNYDKDAFDQFINDSYQMKYFEVKLNKDTALLAKGCDAVIAFVNDTIDRDTIDVLYELGIKVLAMRSAGYNNVDVKAAYKKIHILRVPSYSPHAIAEHTMALLLALNRKIYRAYNRIRDFNFSLNGLTGFDLYQKTIGIIGSGRIGQAFINICRGFGMNILVNDAYPMANSDYNYVSLDELLKQSDIISLHCPLTAETKHMINEQSIEKMKNGVYILNTSRGGLIDSEALLKALKSGKVKGAGLDVYEEEADLFYEDYSNIVINDDILSLLISMPNVILTSHQAFLTQEALQAIAQTTISNLDKYFNNEFLDNEVCYVCKKGIDAKNCRKMSKSNCF